VVAVPATSAVFVDSLAIVGAPAEPATVVIAADPVTEVGNRPVPVAVNVAVPVALLRTIKYVAPSVKLAFVNAALIAVELAALKKLTVEVVDANVIASPEPRDAVAPVESARVNLYSAPPVVPVIVEPPVTAVIVAVEGVPPVVAVNVVEVRFAPMFAVDNPAIRVLVLYAAAPVPTKNKMVYEPVASGVKFSVSDCVAVESPVAETY
jgi:hypothetical protein